MPSQDAAQTVVVVRCPSQSDYHHQKGAQSDNGFDALCDMMRTAAQFGTLMLVADEETQERASSIVRAYGTSRSRVVIVPNNAERATIFAVTAAIASRIDEGATLLSVGIPMPTEDGTFARVLNDLVAGASKIDGACVPACSENTEELASPGTFAVNTKTALETVRQLAPLLVKLCSASLPRNIHDDILIRPDADLLGLAPRESLRRILKPLVRDVSTGGLATNDLQLLEPTFPGDSPMRHNSSPRHDQPPRRTAIVRRASRHSGQLWRLLPGEATTATGSKRSEANRPVAPQRQG